VNLIILLQLDYYDALLLENLNILLKLDYYHVTIVDKFNYFIKVRLLWQNYDLRILTFYYSFVIMIELWLPNLNILLKLSQNDKNIIRNF
jgi:hypothetical protein